jgi:phospholipase/carboxylesterase
MIEQLDPIFIEPENNAEFAIIWLHGLGADGHDFVPIVPELKLGDVAIRFIFPNAPIRPVTINNGIPMPAWYDIRGMDIADKEDSVGMQASHSYLQSLIDQEIDKGIPAGNIIVAGFSQGGAVALYTTLRFSQPLAGCMALSTYLPFMSKSKEEKSTHSSDTPIFWGHGTQDTVVPLDLGETSKEHLTDLGFNIRSYTYPMPHSVCAEEVIDISRWIKDCFDIR